jgi:hypothetical protein
MPTTLIRFVVKYAMIINYTLSRLRTDGYSTGLVNVVGDSVWDMTLLHWVMDPDVSVESSAFICWVGWVPKGSVIRLHIDAASYPPKNGIFSCTAART